MTRAELSAEVEQSKNLQQKLKSTPASSATVPAATAATHGVTDSLKLEIEQLTTKLNLNEDLTGFAVHSVRQEEMGAAYTCMLSDCAGVTGSESSRSGVRVRSGSRLTVVTRVNRLELQAGLPPGRHRLVHAGCRPYPRRPPRRAPADVPASLHEVCLGLRNVTTGACVDPCDAFRRFAADHSSEFFKRLFTSINKVKL